MSDYLSHLVARSLNLAEAIQPRFASRFEPRDLGVANSLSRLEEVETEVSGSQAQRFSQSNQRLRSPTDPPAEDLFIQPLQPSARPTSTPLESSTQPSVRPASTPLESSTWKASEILPQTAIPRESSQLIQPESMEVTSTESQNITPQVPIERVPVLKPMIQRLIERINPAADSTLQTMLQSSERSNVEQTIGNPIQPAIQPAVLAPAVSPVISSDINNAGINQLRIPATLLDCPESGSAKPEQPVIRVTIGRIDVRLVSSPAPSKPQPKEAAPKLSLDDFLKSRNGGSK